VGPRVPDRCRAAAADHAGRRVTLSVVTTAMLRCWRPGALGGVRV
jgi:hypothetical protein